MAFSPLEPAHFTLSLAVFLAATGGAYPRAELDALRTSTATSTESQNESTGIGSQKEGDVIKLAALREFPMAGKAYFNTPTRSKRKPRQNRCRGQQSESRISRRDEVTYILRGRDP